MTSMSRPSGTFLGISSRLNGSHASYTCAVLLGRGWPRWNSHRSNASFTSWKPRAYTAKKRYAKTLVNALAGDTSSFNSYSAASASSDGALLNHTFTTLRHESSRNGNCSRLRRNSNRFDKRTMRAGWQTEHTMSMRIATDAAARSLKAPVRIESIVPFVRSAKVPYARRALNTSYGLLAAFMVDRGASSTTVFVRRRLRNPASWMPLLQMAVFNLSPVERTSPLNLSAPLLRCNVQLRACPTTQCPDSMASRQTISKS